MKNALLILSMPIFAFGICGYAHADTVVFKNGDKLTGTLVSVSDSTLELKSDNVGDVSIALAKIQSYSADKPAVVVEKDHTHARGQ